MSLAKIVLHPSALSGDALPALCDETGLVPVQSNRHKGRVILITQEDYAIRQALQDVGFGEPDLHA